MFGKIALTRAVLVLAAFGCPMAAIAQVPPLAITISPGANIQNAINSAPSGSTIVFAPGVYNVSQVINLKSTISLDGQSGARLLSNGNVGIFKGLGVHDITISGFTLDGNNGGPSSSGGIYLDSSNGNNNGTPSENIHITNNIFQNWMNTTGTNLWLWRTQDTYVHGNTFKNGYEGVSWATAPGTPPLNNLAIYNNTITGMQFMGIETGFASTISNLHIDYNTITNIGDTSISFVEGVSGANIVSGTVWGNHVDGANSGGVLFELGSFGGAAFNITISQNVLSNHKWAMSFSHTPGMAVLNNTFTGVQYPFSDNGGYDNTEWIGANRVDGTTENGWAGHRYGAAPTLFTPLPLESGIVLPAAHDFNGDNKSDMLWHQNSGAVGIWLMNGPTSQSQGGLGAVVTSWQIAGTSSLVQSTGDFDGDGKADILWRHSGGDVAIWLMNGTSPKLSLDIGNVTTAWQIAGVGDFNGDGKADILWRHSGGDVAIWLMNGLIPTTQIDIGNVPAAWQIAGIGDFDGDGKADILWRHSGGDVAIWLMNGTTPKLALDIGNVPTAWRIAGVADFDGDGKADIVWRHNGGDVSIWEMNGTAAKLAVDIGNVSTAWQIVSTGDYDGDGKGDLLWRNSAGDVSMWEMNGTTPKVLTVIGNVATSWTTVE